MRALFEELDRDQNGRISLDEFVDEYFQQQVQVEQRIEELERLTAEDTKKRSDIFAKLEEISSSEQVNQYGVMLHSILTAKVVEGRGLRPTGQVVVVMSIEGQTAATEPVTATADPVWKEVITFDIETGSDQLVVQLVDASSGRIYG